MLKIKDKSGKTKLVLRDEDDEPISIDELILRESAKKQAVKETEDATDQTPTTPAN